MSRSGSCSSVPSKKRPDSKKAAQPRLRVLAGPNGSGKSTINCGYRVYLYFVATDDPAINVDRVRRRVKQGGHPVPAKKVRERYARSIGLMTEACGVAHRAYVFDNSGSKHKLLAQIVDGKQMEIEAATLPRWFIETELWRSFNG